MTFFRRSLAAMVALFGLAQSVPMPTVRTISAPFTATPFKRSRSGSRIGQAEKKRARNRRRNKIARQSRAINRRRAA